MPFKSDRKLVGGHFMTSAHSVFGVTSIPGCYCQRVFTRNFLDCIWAQNNCSACWFEVKKERRAWFALQWCPLSNAKSSHKIIFVHYWQRRMTNLTDFEAERNSQMAWAGDSFEQIRPSLKQLRGRVGRQDARPTLPLTHGQVTLADTNAQWWDWKQTPRLKES